MFGLRAAKQAGMACVVTYTGATSLKDYYGAGADAKLRDLSRGVRVADLFCSGDGGPRVRAADDLLAGRRDTRTAGAPLRLKEEHEMPIL